MWRSCPVGMVLLQQKAESTYLKVDLDLWVKSSGWECLGGKGIIVEYADYKD
jgi:hypothetical protein